MRYLSSILLAGSILAAPTAVAQQRSQAVKPKQPPIRAWVKLCETPAAGSMDIFGKPNAAGVKTCLIHQEQLNATSGAVLVAAGVRQAQGRQTLMVKVPAGVDREPGARLLIYPRDIWQKVQRRERVAPADSQRLRPVSLSYTYCHAEGCVAETDATPDLVADLKSSGGFLIMTLKDRHAVGYPLSLSGFGEAYDGPPVDSARYHEARAKLLRQIRERQQQGLQQGVQPPRYPGQAPGGVPPVQPGEGLRVPGRPGGQDI